ncbi:MAG: PAS domain-containing protein [Bacteroidetes bacterium]|jgi:signal transduction histidine kinase|nr:PAS domain-containing protein [Bacteroidota bacterium]
MSRSYCFILVFFICIIPIRLTGNDTLVIDGSENIVDLSGYLYLFEDESNTISFCDLLNNFHHFELQQHKKGSFNFEFSTSTYWINFNIKNTALKPIDYRLEITNPDLDHVSFFEFGKDTVFKSIITGELHDVNTREIPHRNFLFSINIPPGESRSYLLKANNNGHSFFIPLHLSKQEYFEFSDYKSEMLNWFNYGILIFILIFHVYLYRSTKDKINIYYSLSLLFSTIFFLHYEGYFYLFNTPGFIEKIKWITPSLFIVFHLTFAQEFINYNNKLRNIRKFVAPFKYFAIVGVFFYPLPYPYSLVSDIGLSLLIIATFTFIVLIATLSVRKDYPPSKIFLLAFYCALVGMLIHQLREFGGLRTNIFIINAIKIGLTCQNILLTVAILERFRFEQENTKKTIEKNYHQIELQNKEFEIINSELEKLSVVASETDNGIAIYDIDGNLEWCNKKFEQYYDVNLIELIESKQHHISSIVTNDQINDFFSKCIKKMEAMQFETHVTTKGSKKIWVQTTLSPYIRADKLQKIISIDSDISNLKKIEKNLQKAKEDAEEADRLKTVFLGNMSHEIRTPLNGIIGFSDLLFSTELDKEKQKRYLLLIKNNGEQLMNIIEDVVDISLIESNQLRVNLKESDLTQVFNETIEFFESYRFSINKTTVEIDQQINIPPAYLKITTDSFRLKQVLNNLLKNAFKFTDEGHVRLGCYKENDRLVIYVEDTGIGVNSDVREQIFMRFRQAEETLTRKYGGNGLGLAISKGIVEKLGGEIWLDTSYKKGARFCFTIPLSTVVQELN